MWTGDLDLSHLPEAQFESSLFITDGFYVVVPDSWVKFWNGNYEVPVFVCLYMCYRSMALPKLILKELYLIGLKEIKCLYKYSNIKKLARMSFRFT